jgi:hypothetical protein
VVIHDFYIVRIAVNPSETDAPLVIDTDTVLTFTVAAQSFKPVAWWCKQVLKRLGRVNVIQLAPRRSLERLETPDKPVVKKRFSILVMKGFYHLHTILAIACYYVKRNSTQGNINTVSALGG